MADKNENNNSKKAKSETIGELAHRHLKDATHTTTDDELRNAKLELTGAVEEDPANLFEVDNTLVVASKSEEVEDDSDSNKDEDTKKEKGELPNPYSVLG